MSDQDYTDTILFRKMLFERLDRTDEILDNLVKSIKGNGVPGCQETHREMLRYLETDVKPLVKDYNENKDSFKKTAKKVNVLDTINFVFKHWKPVAVILSLAVAGLLSIAGYSTLEAKQHAEQAIEALNTIKGLIK